jgi:broad specificity phosphatase PhoE
MIIRPKRIILVRHAESEGNVDKTIYAHTPDYALGITEWGRAQAEAAGDSIAKMIGDESIKFYVSTHRRTILTYENILHRMVLADARPEKFFKPYFDPRLREQDWGNFRNDEATAKIEEERDRYGAFHYRFPNGESCADVYDRCSLSLDTLFRDWTIPWWRWPVRHRYVPENVCIVSHGRTIRVWLMKWFKWSVEEFEQYRNPPNCGIIVLTRNRTGKYDISNSCLTKYENYKSPEQARQEYANATAKV